MEEKEHIESREYVEAVPGPAIVISKETYRNIQEHNSAEENRRRLNNAKKYYKNFKNIHNLTGSPFNKQTDEDTSSLEDTHQL